MSVVYLVRHGQAILHGPDYDQLSDTGHRQARLAGEALAARGVRPSLVVRGSLERHRQTADEAASAAGWPRGTEVDGRWDELDHVNVIAANRPNYTSHAVMMADLSEGSDPEDAFIRLYDAALRNWLVDDGSYVETYAAFQARIGRALGEITDGLSDRETAVVFTSGGPISTVAASDLGQDSSAWFALGRVTINAAMTKVVVGRSGLSLVSFNDHSHLESHDVTTYR
ncbi:MAG: histidine phosphatase family protein [Nocardioidaceae bacterium]